MTEPTIICATNGGKRWHYVLIPHTSIAANMMPNGLAGQFSV
jgi:hypothetical protein